jgi:hypothetical protein
MVQASTGRQYFQVRDLADLLGTNARRVEGWVEQGFLKPAVRGRGPGRPHKFTLDHLLQGALLLEVQANFGEKSPVCGRLFPDVARSLVGIARDQARKPGATEPGDVILAVTQDQGQIVHIGILERTQHILAFVNRDLVHGRTVSLFNVSGILGKLHQRTMEMAQGTPDKTPFVSP